MPPTQSEINNIVWRACDTFRGVVDPSDYKNYVLVTLFEGEPVEIRRGGETPDHVRLGVQPWGLDGSEP